MDLCEKVSGLDFDDNIEDLIQRARGGDRDAVGQLLEQFRDVLRVDARRRMGTMLNPRIAVSDVVQQTLIEAHQSFQQIAGAKQGELQAWLRLILTCNITNAVRDHLYVKKRSLNRERSITQSDSVLWRDGSLPSDNNTPSLEACRIEESLLLLEQLDKLPVDQSAAVRMRYLECRSIGEIAIELGRSKTAAAGLVKRGMEKLRNRMNDESPSKETQN